MCISMPQESYDTDNKTLTIPAQLAGYMLPLTKGYDMDLESKIKKILEKRMPDKGKEDEQRQTLEGFLQEDFIKAPTEDTSNNTYWRFPLNVALCTNEDFDSADFDYATSSRISGLWLYLVLGIVKPKECYEKNDQRELTKEAITEVIGSPAETFSDEIKALMPEEGPKKSAFLSAVDKERETNRAAVEQGMFHPSERQGLRHRNESSKKDGASVPLDVVVAGR